jgi:hypothetical protein
MRVTIDQEIVSAARAYVRGRRAHKANPKSRSATTALDLAAHAFAALLADRVLDAEADAFIEDLSEASTHMREELHP